MEVGNKDKGQEVCTTKSQRSMKGKDGDSAWQEAWVELPSGAFYLTSFWKALLSAGISTAWYDAKRFTAWYQIDQLPVVWWFLRYFFAWSHPSSSCEYLTSLKHTFVFVFLFTPSSLSLICFRLKWFPILRISLCVFYFLEMFSMEGKAIVIFFSEGVTTSPLESCSVLHSDFVPYKMSPLLAALWAAWTSRKKKSSVVSEMDRKPQSRRPWTSIELSGWLISS